MSCTAATCTKAKQGNKERALIFGSQLCFGETETLFSSRHGGILQHKFEEREND